MSITITLRDELATKLSQRAAGQNVTVEDLAVGILEEAVSEPADGFEVWSKLSARRLKLISREFASGLADREEEVLTALQGAAAKTRAPQDFLLLATLNGYEVCASDFERRSE